MIQVFETWSDSIVICLLSSTPVGMMRSPTWLVMMGGHWGQFAALSGLMTHCPVTIWKLRKTDIVLANTSFIVVWGSILCIESNVLDKNIFIIVYSDKKSVHTFHVTCMIVENCTSVKLVEWHEEDYVIYWMNPTVGTGVLYNDQKMSWW